MVYIPSILTQRIRSPEWETGPNKLPQQENKAFTINIYPCTKYCPLLKTLLLYFRQTYMVSMSIPITHACMCVSCVCKIIPYILQYCVPCDYPFCVSCPKSTYCKNHYTSGSNAYFTVQSTTHSQWYSVSVVCLKQKRSCRSICVQIQQLVYTWKCFW